jgi:hypothetical protein
MWRRRVHLVSKSRGSSSILKLCSCAYTRKAKQLANRTIMSCTLSDQSPKTRPLHGMLSSSFQLDCNSIHCHTDIQVTPVLVCACSYICIVGSVLKFLISKVRAFSRLHSMARPGMLHDSMHDCRHGCERFGFSMYASAIIVCVFD